MRMSDVPGVVTGSPDVVTDTSLQMDHLLVEQIPCRVVACNNEPVWLALFEEPVCCLVVYCAECGPEMHDYFRQEDLAYCERHSQYFHYKKMVPWG